MKKTLIAMAALAAVGAASAQVSIYGAVDASFNYMSSGDLSANKLNNSQLGSSKLGFTGVEDLGGGMSAIFKLEGGLANDSGNGKSSNSNNQVTGGCTASGVTPTVAGSVIPCATNGSQGLDFQRYSYVGLKGGFGELRLGREYNMAFQHGQAATDPFGTNGPADSTLMFYKVGSSTGMASAVNSSNGISYNSPNMGGVTFGAMYYMGENTQGPNNNGSGYAGYVDFTGGPVFVTLAQSQTNASPTTTTGFVNDGAYTQRSLAFSYDLGVAKLAFTWAHEENDSRGNITPKNDALLFGVTVPMGAMNLKASYIQATLNTGVAGAKDEKGQLIGLGFDYALSKRTKAYVTYATVANTDSARFSTGVIDATKKDPTSNNVAVGVFHAF